MADRTSAALFGSIFDHLAEGKPSKKDRDFALWLWTQTGDYDFSEYQMDCDESLVKLGLAEKTKDEAGYETMLYGPEGNRE